LEKSLSVSEYLNHHGIKPSLHRIKIYEYLKTRDIHPTVDEIYQDMVHDIPTLSKTTVYNTLRLFVDKKIASMITIEEHEARYDADTHIHGHFKCKVCDKIYDFDLDTNFANTDSHTLNHFQIDEKHLYYKGVCKHCLHGSMKT